MELSGLDRYVYGTTRLGDGSIPFDSRVAIARSAITAGGWIHTSHTYGEALSVLRAAFDAEPSRVPQAIFKIGWDSVPQVREVIAQNLEPLGLSSMAVGQLCLGGALAEEYRSGGPAIGELLRLKEEGLVDRFVLEVWPWNSAEYLDALEAGFADQLVDGFIFYLNPLQRFVSNELWDALVARRVPIVAMRTVGGGDVRAIAAGRGPEYLQKRAAQVLPLFERSECASWPEFCVRYVFGFPSVVATVGATSRQDGLQEFHTAVASAATPLPSDIHAELVGLQRRWSDDHDRHTAPWSM